MSQTGERGRCLRRRMACGDIPVGRTTPLLLPSCDGLRVAVPLGMGPTRTPVRPLWDSRGSPTTHFPYRTRTPRVRPPVPRTEGENPPHLPGPTPPTTVHQWDSGPDFCRRVWSRGVPWSRRPAPRGAEGAGTTRSPDEQGRPRVDEALGVLPLGRRQRRGAPRPCALRVLPTSPSTPASPGTPRLGAEEVVAQTTDVGTVLLLVPGIVVQKGRGRRRGPVPPVWTALPQPTLVPPADRPRLTGLGRRGPTGTPTGGVVVLAGRTGVGVGLPTHGSTAGTVRALSVPWPETDPDVTTVRLPG